MSSGLYRGQNLVLVLAPALLAIYWAFPHKPVSRRRDIVGRVVLLGAMTAALIGTALAAWLGYLG